MEDPPIVELDVEWRCGCGGRGAGLEVLKDVQRAYEDRLEDIERNGGRNKLQLQAALLRSWVGDLVGQNTLLARAVTQLERDATARLAERRRYNEMLAEARAEAAFLRRALTRKEKDNQALLKVLIYCRDRDIPRDNIHFMEITESQILGPEKSKEKPSTDLDLHDLHLQSFRRQVQQTLSRIRPDKQLI